MSDRGTGTLGVLILQPCSALHMGGATTLEAPPTEHQERGQRSTKTQSMSTTSDLCCPTHRNDSKGRSQEEEGAQEAVQD